jgi:hypothetical protein
MFHASCQDVQMNAEEQLHVPFEFSTEFVLKNGFLNLTLLHTA